MLLFKLIASGACIGVWVNFERVSKGVWRPDRSVPEGIVATASFLQHGNNVFWS